MEDNTASFTASNLAAYEEEASPPPRGTAKEVAPIRRVVVVGIVRNASTAVSSTTTATAAMAIRRQGTENFILMMCLFLFVGNLLKTRLTGWSSCYESVRVGWFWVWLFASALSSLSSLLFAVVLLLCLSLDACLSSLGYRLLLSIIVPAGKSIEIQTWQQIPIGFCCAGRTNFANRPLFSRILGNNLYFSATKQQQRKEQHRKGTKGKGNKSKPPDVIILGKT